MKVALVYDRVNKFGGAEQVLLALHKIWPNAPLYTSVYDKSLTPWADVFDVRTSFLQKLPLPKNKHEMYPFLMGIAFESFNFDDYDVVISVTHEFAKAIITRPQTLHVCYCLTPVGYLWSGYSQYFFGKPAWFQALTKPIIAYLRWYDKIISQRPDLYVTISRTVRERIKKYYQRDSEVIYPPVNVPKISNFKLAPRSFGTQISNYFLIVSRLVPQKRIDIAVQAFNQLDLPLKIVGTGILKEKLRAKAKNNIEFLGHVSNEELTRLYSCCRAVIIPGEEDFNIVSVEAQSFGKPVIAYGKGGVTETVIDGKTGWFFPEQTTDSLVGILKRMSPDKIEAIQPEECKGNANRFTQEKFSVQFKNLIDAKFKSFSKDN